MEKAEELLSEINTFLDDDPVLSEAGTKDPDENSLPFESLEDFSTDPVEFSEMAARMLAKVENLFDLTAVCNRHSGNYLKACSFLEKGIRFLGSACITKIAMELRDYSFPELSQLTTMKLYRMASFNYRKLDAALTEKLEHRNDLYPELLDMEFRFFNLVRRLRSTETKIYNYHFKKYYENENYDPVLEGNAFTEESWTKRYTQDKEEAPAFRNAPAFPLIRNSAFVVQKSAKNLKHKAKDGNESTPYPVPGTQKASGSGSREQRTGKDNDIPESEGSGQNSERLTSESEEAFNAEKIISHSEENFHSKESCRSYTDEKGKIHIDVSGLRQQMMKEAHDSGEIDLMMEIAGEPSEKLYERWRQKYGGDPLTRPAASSRSGPPEMTRKKLRGKRKKRK